MQNYAQELFLRALKELKEQCPSARFSFDKMQTVFGKAYLKMPVEHEISLKPFASTEEIDMFSPSLDAFLEQAETSRIVVANGGNRNRFQVTSRVDGALHPLNGNELMLSKEFSAKVVAEWKNLERGKERV